MAETIISPGVFTRENDISFIQPASVEAGAAFVGPTVKGPVEIPTVITSYNAYVRKFGETFESGSSKQEYLTSLAVKSYFQQELFRRGILWAAYHSLSWSHKEKDINKTLEVFDEIMGLFKKIILKGFPITRIVVNTP